MSAGFWHTKLTPLHGALIAAAVATDGTIPSPRLVNRLVGPNGQVVQAPKLPPLSRAMSAKAANQLRKAMSETIRRGTGRRAFASWPAQLKDITIGGKTGTLSKRTPYTSYTWFVGYAPVDNPEIAIAVMVGNSELWWQRAVDIAKSVLETYFRREAKRSKKTQ